MVKFPRMYRTVTTTPGRPESPIDMIQVNEASKAILEQRAMEAHNKKVYEEHKRQEFLKAQQESLFASQRLPTLKNKAINECTNGLGDKFFTIAFNSIYIKALPHDQSFVNENWATIEKLGEFYIRKLGGLKYLATVEKTTPFLHKLYTICNEACKKARDTRVKKVMCAKTDEELYEVINQYSDVTQDERNNILNKIDSLSPDELAELVHDKIISVVKDEHIREKEARDFKTDLKNDLVDSDPYANTDDTETSSTEVENEGETTEENTEENPEESAPSSESALFTYGIRNYKSFKEALENYDPVTKRFNTNKAQKPKSLFGAMMVDIAIDKFHTSMESSGVKPTPRVTPKVLMENPTNLDKFIEFMNDSRHNDWNVGDASEPIEVASNDVMSDYVEDILTEATLQYGLLETAYTMKLINPTYAQLVAQSNWLLRR